jgi:RNA polymerase sigma factor (TIGR02999 family)
MSDPAPVLNGLEGREPQAASDLLPLVYEELRKLAAHKLANEAPGQTLQPTALVHEAWLRLVRAANPGFENRGHFFAAAAEAMRRILVENARRKHRLKRGGHQQRVSLDELQLATESDPATLLSLDEALEKLGQQHPEKAALVKLRFFAGLSLPEAAQTLGLSLTTAKRHWSKPLRVWGEWAGFVRQNFLWNDRRRRLHRLRLGVYHQHGRHRVLDLV